jgi:DNA-directed RNA polymerase specialized sigma24 family protein
MLSPAHLQFRTMSPEAQRAALQRLAWRGCDPGTISAQTGIPETEVQRLIDSPVMAIDRLNYLRRIPSRRR